MTVCMSLDPKWFLVAETKVMMQITKAIPGNENIIIPMSYKAY